MKIKAGDLPSELDPIPGPLCPSCGVPMQRIMLIACGPDEESSWAEEQEPECHTPECPNQRVSP